MPEEVLVEDLDHTRILTINRPEVHNAVNSGVWIGLSEALSAASEDTRIRVVILTGAGRTTFCAGADLKAISRGESLFGDNQEARQHGFAGFCRHPIAKPTIAAVNGHALGGGMELVLAADLCVASREARFGLPEVRRGIMAGGGGALRLGQQLPRKVAMELLFTGNELSAERALSLGLVNSVVPSDAVLSSALDLAESISRGAPLAVQATKRVAQGILDGRRVFEDELWKLNDIERALLKESNDAKEGPKAFVEKREPRWSST